MTDSTSSRESQRLQTLRAYELMDTAAEASFDRLTTLAGIICDTSISLISLVDESRQWFKSRVGVDADETPREWAFCAHAIEQDEGLFIVPDASNDQRFAQNPLVTSDPNIRFYAGAPLRMEKGDVLGTLCVIDRKPRKITARQEEALATLRDAVVSLMELRRLQADMLRIGRLLPMCAWCHSIRSGEGETADWQPLGDYVLQTNEVTHCICPSCSRRLRKETASAS